MVYLYLLEELKELMWELGMYNIQNHQENRMEEKVNDFQFQYQSFDLLNVNHKIVVVQKNDDDNKSNHLLNQIHHLKKKKFRFIFSRKIKKSCFNLDEEEYDK